jgi:hypothetical protein
LADRTAVSQLSFWDGAKGRGPFDFNRMNTALVEKAEPNLITFSADIRLISGGPDGRRYLTDDDSAVRAFWCNTSLRPRGDAEMHGLYTGGRQVRSRYAVAPSRMQYRPEVYASPVPLLEWPILDASEPVDIPEKIKLSNARTSNSTGNVPPGWILTVSGEDLPNDDLPLLHPADRTQTLTRLSLNTQFLAGIYLWSVSAPWVIGIVATTRWEVQADISFQAPADLEDETWTYIVHVAPYVAKQNAVLIDPVRPANQVGISAWPPGNTAHLAKLTY